MFLKLMLQIIEPFQKNPSFSFLPPPKYKNAEIVI